MYNLVMKDLKLGVSPWLLAMPFMTGVLMLIPGWIYFLVVMYFIWLSVPNMFAAFKTQNDLIFTAMMPVTRHDIVKARVALIVILECLHIGVAMLFGLITLQLYPDMTYLFFAPHLGFWGLNFAMLAVFNLIFISLHYETAYRYGKATIASIVAAMLFAGGAQWLGIQNAAVYDVFNGSGADKALLQASILLAGIAVFALFTWIAYRIAVKRFQKVEIQ